MMTVACGGAGLSIGSNGRICAALAAGGVRTVDARAALPQITLTASAVTSGAYLTHMVSSCSLPLREHPRSSDQLNDFAASPQRPKVRQITRSRRIRVKMG